MSWASLTRRLKILETARPQSAPNFLETDEWVIIRSILLKESAPYPETKEALSQAIFVLERGGYASEQLVADTIVAALPWSDVRWAVAEALWKVGHPE